MDKAADADDVRIFIDADACPVKDEVYKVAQRYRLRTFVVSNSFIAIPQHPLIERRIVEQGPDAADDWIAETVRREDVAVTADMPLAARCLEVGARVIGPTGRPFTPDSIGMALAGRAVGEHLRSMGLATGGPKPFGPADRSRFLSALDEAVNKGRRALKQSPRT